MLDVKFATLIVTSANVNAARALASGLSSGGSGMFSAPLSASGAPPATHYCSTGFIASEFWDAMSSGANLHAKCQEKGTLFSLAACNKLILESDVSTEGPFSAFERLGLKLVQEEI